MLMAGLAVQARAQGANDEQEQQMMAEWIKLGSPSEHHQKLDPYVGSWDVKLTMWMSPDAPAQTTVGASEVAWILDGRFLHEDFACTMDLGGQTHEFKGMGLLGYDNAEEEYVSMWVDNMNTMLMIFDDGEYDEQTRTLTLEGEYDDPVAGGETEMTSVSRVVSDDELHLELYSKPKDGEKYKCMEMVYTRQQ